MFNLSEVAKPAKSLAIETKMMWVTPEIAKKYLERNTENRTLRPHWVNTLALAIKNNEFITTHQSIAFSKSGRLLDGQHRLHAIIQANKAGKCSLRLIFLKMLSKQLIVV
jgi:hypothetical protein